MVYGIVNMRTHKRGLFVFEYKCVRHLLTLSEFDLCYVYKELSIYQFV